TVATPTWLLLRGTSAPESRIAWEQWRETTDRILKASGGVSCDSSGLMRMWKALCEKSEEALREKKPSVYEYQTGDMSLTCDFDGRAVHLTIEIIAPKDDNCRALKPDGPLRHRPGFRLNPAGYLSSVHFQSEDGKRYILPLKSCRNKKYPPASAPQELCEAYDPRPRDPGKSP
nr:hypothetical protein [Bdellovibrionales bacterium]